MCWLVSSIIPVLNVKPVSSPGNADCRDEGPADLPESSCCDHVHDHGRSRSHGDARDRGCAHEHSRSDSRDVWTDSFDVLCTHAPAQCAVSTHVAADCEQARCPRCQPHCTSNVLVMVRANELIAASRVNSFLAITAVLYVSVTIVCTILTSDGCDLSESDCSPATTPEVFHALEFWGAFVFNMVDVLALSYSQYGSPLLLKLIVLTNVALSFSSCLLVSINVEKFEVLAHELEYFNEFTMAVFDIAILTKLARGRSPNTDRRNGLAILSALAVVCVAVAQICIYNLSGWTADGESKGELAAHYVEFLFGMASAGITFWFTMDNKLSADKCLQQLMCSSQQMALP